MQVNHCVVNGMGFTGEVYLNAFTTDLKDESFLYGEGMIGRKEFKAFV